MVPNTATYYNECRTVVVGGIFYDFATAQDAACFVRAVESGTPARLAYRLLTDPIIFPKRTH